MYNDMEQKIIGHAEALLSAASAEIMAADEIVICNEGGFGHQLHGVDLIRRFWSGKNILFIFMEWLGRHNPCIPLLCTAPRILHVPVLPVSLEGECQPVSNDLPAWSAKLARWVHETIVTRFGRKALNYEGFLHYVACSFPIQHYLEVRGLRSSNWVAAYYKLLETTTVERRRLPPGLRDVVFRYLRDQWGVEAGAPIATLYLRQKGGGLDSTSRSGSPPQDYLPAITFLYRKGYRVFVIGDVRFACDGAVHVDAIAERLVEQGVFSALESEMAAADPLNFAFNWASFGKASVRAKVYLSRKLLDLFFMTEADFFVGEAGGGIQMSPHEGIPTVNVNVIPYHTALPNTAHLYKVVHDQQGRLVPYQFLLTRWKWLHSFPGFFVRNNDAYEILDAVATCVNNLGAHPLGVGRSQLIGGEEGLWMLHCSGVISPAFFRIYERGTLVPNDALP